MIANKNFPRRYGDKQAEQINGRLVHQAGFSLLELIIVVIISLIISAMAIPGIVSSMRLARLRGAASDVSGIYEQARIYSIRDNRFYGAYILPASGSTPQGTYVDMLPKSLTGSSGNGGVSVVSGDPLVTLSSEVVQKPVASAPNTSNLQTQLLPSTTPVTPTDTSAVAATFGPRGLPCLPLSLTGGSVCDSSGGPVAYWTFLQNTNSGNWQAVTITPAGRIQKWYYTGSAWQKI